MKAQRRFACGAGNWILSTFTDIMTISTHRVNTHLKTGDYHSDAPALQKGRWPEFYHLEILRQDILTCFRSANKE